MKKTLNWFKETFEGTWLYNFVSKFIMSADNSKTGFSGKKATIISLTYCVIKMHNYWLEHALATGDFSLFPIILGSDFATILALFGINQIDKKRGDSINISNDVTT